MSNIVPSAENLYAEFLAAKALSEEAEGRKPTLLGYSPESVFFGVADPTPPDPDLSPSKKCVASKNSNQGDGRWNSDRNKYDEFPCRKKECPRHWRRYARRLYRRIKKRLRHHPHWSFARLSTFSRDTQKINQSLRRLATKFHSHYPLSQIITVWHQGRAGIHLHAIIGSDTPVDPDDLKLFWKSHRPNKNKKKWHANHVHFQSQLRCEKPVNPLGALWYCLYSKNQKPREQCPWRGIDRRTPYGISTGH